MNTSRVLLACVGLAATLFQGAAVVLADEGGEGRGAGGGTPGQGHPPLCIVEFFHEPGCAQCDRIDDEILPELSARLGDAVELRRWDVTTTDGYQRRMQVQKALDIQTNASSLAVVDGRIALAGLAEIQGELIPVAEMRVAQALADGYQAPTVASTEASAQRKATAEELALEHLRSFSAVGVAVAGLVDGINPCAIATLVFMVSLLAALRVRGWQLIVAGIAFCTATFLTYFALGFGLLSALDSLAGFTALQAGMEAAMIAVLGVLAALSFGDAWRYARTGRPDAVVLKLPERGSRMVRRVVHDQFRRRNLVAGAFLAGAVVTAIESVCTGQVYVPTLVYLVRVRQETGAAIGYLTLYNLMFLVPLLVAFGLAYFGMETERFLDFSRTNVVAAKVLLGCLFIALGVALVLV